MKEKIFYHKNIVVARKNKFEKFDRDNYFRRDSKNLTSIFLIGLYLGSGPHRQVARLRKSSIFKHFQFWKPEISKSTQPNPTKFQERVRHVPKDYQKVYFVTKYISPICRANLKKMTRKWNKIGPTLPNLKIFSIIIFSFFVGQKNCTKSTSRIVSR